MTDPRKMTNWIWGLVSAILLSVVTAHAIAPVKPDHGRGRGSAFSASTAEVSLKSGASTIVVRDVVQADPLGPQPHGPGLVSPMAVHTVHILPRSQAAAPRLARALLSPVGSRAPPAA